MLTFALLLAAADPSRVSAPDPTQARPPGLAWQDVFLIAGGLLILGLILLLFVYMTRKKHRPRYSEGGAKVIYKADPKELERSTRRMKRRRRRRDHPENLPRNPTLAEAGGLPPIRPEKPAEPQH